jgi:uncharacterized membrane protein
MNQMLVVVFDTETAAFEGLSALRDLHKEGGVSLYATAVIAKDKTGRISIKQEVERGPTGAAFGLLTGSLIGLLGGPAGFAIGASVGGLSGFLFDLQRVVVGSTFLADVSEALGPGKAAVLAEIEESWTSLVDERVRKHGGTVFRQFRVDVVDDQLAREGTAFEASLKSLQDELQHASAEQKAAVEMDIEHIKKQIRATQDQAAARLDQVKAEMDARVRTLQDQARQAGDRAKARIERRMAEVKADYEVRLKKLNQAWRLAKEALAA